MSAESLRGRLLVATPGLADPNFERTVVLMLEHGGEGALGLVINRPATAEVTEALPEWSEQAAAPAVLFKGGPVEQDAVIAIGQFATTPGLPQTGDEPGGGLDDDTRDESSAESAAVQPLFADLVTVDVSVPPGPLAAALRGVRLFVGYAGWEAGQLESEISAGSWFVVNLDSADLLSPEPAALWRVVLARQAGPLAFVSMFPDDPAMN